jgi:hypothetical protein
MSMADPDKLACADCAHWKRLTNYRGECLLAWRYSTSYREVGALAFHGGAKVYEETKPDYWCRLFEVDPDKAAA